MDADKFNRDTAVQLTEIALAELHKECLEQIYKAATCGAYEQELRCLTLQHAEHVAEFLRARKFDAKIEASTATNVKVYYVQVSWRPTRSRLTSGT